MEKGKRNFILEMAGFFCGLIMVLVSASSMIGKVRTPELIGLIAGSFGAGAALVNTLRTRAAGRPARK